MLAPRGSAPFPTPGNTRTHRSAANHGKPIYFDVIYSWTKAGRLRSLYANAARENLLGSLAGAVHFPGRQRRFRDAPQFTPQRSDTRGALRPGTAVMLTFLAHVELAAHHVASIDEFDSILIALSWALLGTSLIT